MPDFRVHCHILQSITEADSQTHYVCQSCRPILNRNMPCRCILNGLITEPVPKELQVLDPLSKLIQRGNAFQTIFRLGTYTGKVPNYNSLKGTGIDYMHCILLNIVRLLVNLWFDSCHHSQAWSCSRLISVADDRLRSIRPPSSITRAPRTLRDRKFWKASEYRSWLFYYSLPVMLGLLPTQYYQHYGLLCHAIYILNSSSISPRSLKKANKLLLIVLFLLCTWRDI